MKHNEPTYDLVIIGAGVSGAAAAYIAGEFTDMEHILVLEKRSAPGQANSHVTQNSQTLHFGDIETNYTLEKATNTKWKAELIARYVETHTDERLYQKTHKMVLAVGSKEQERIQKRFREFSKLFPELRLVEQEELSVIEPNITKGRLPNEVNALVSPHGYAVNYGKLAKSFMRKAKQTGRVAEKFQTRVRRIQQTEKGYRIETSTESIRAKLVLVAAGAYSLPFAHQLGYGDEYGILPVAGSFYTGKNLLSGKVYTLQMKRLPFAAIHGDPSVENPSETRFGPTAKVVPLLERRHLNTLIPFLLVALRKWSFGTLKNVLLDPVHMRYGLRNTLYDVPLLGKWLFMKQVRKIIPTAKWRDIRYGKGLGGLRPQILNLKEERLQMGEARISGKQIIFAITPSPGASTCLANGIRDIATLTEEGGYVFQTNKAKKKLGDFSLTD